MTELEAAIIEAAQDWADVVTSILYGRIPQKKIDRYGDALLKAVGDLASENDGRWKKPE